MKLIKRLFLVFMALLLAATAAVTAVTGIRILMNPETSAFTQVEAFGILALSCAALGCIFLVQRILRETYRDD